MPPGRKPKVLKKSLANKYPPVEAGVTTWTEWPNLNAYSKANGITRLALIRLIDEGEYSCFTCPDGTIRIPPDVEAELDEELSLNAEEEAEEVQAQADMGVVLSQCVAMLKTSNDFIDKLLTSVVKPLEQITRANETMMVRNQTRLTELENKRDELVAQREEMLSEEAERRFAQTRIEAEEKRKDQAWGEVIKLFPTLAEQLKSTFGNFGGRDRQAFKAAMSLFATLEPEQLELLGSDQLGFLSAEQRSHLAELVKHMPSREAKPTVPSVEPSSTAPAVEDKPKRKTKKQEEGSDDG